MKNSALGALFLMTTMLIVTPSYADNDHTQVNTASVDHVQPSFDQIFSTSAQIVALAAIMSGSWKIAAHPNWNPGDLSVRFLDEAAYYIGLIQIAFGIPTIFTAYKNKIWREDFDLEKLPHTIGVGVLALFPACIGMLIGHRLVP